MALGDLDREVSLGEDAQWVGGVWAQGRMGWEVVGAGRAEGQLSRHKLKVWVGGQAYVMRPEYRSRGPPFGPPSARHQGDNSSSLSLSFPNGKVWVIIIPTQRTIDRGNKTMHVNCCASCQT